MFYPFLQVHQSAKANPNLQPPADKALAERLAAEHIARIRSSGIRWVGLPVFYQLPGHRSHRMSASQHNIQF